MKTLVLGLALLLVPAAGALAAPADLDTTFSQDGAAQIDSGGAEYAHSVAVQENGKVLVAGVTSVGLNAVVYRLKRNGVLDRSFSSDGKRPIDEGGADSLNAVVRQPDGRILLAGRTSNGTVGTDGTLYRLNANGTFDRTFSGDGRRNLNFGGDETAEAMALLPNGKILVAGRTSVGQDAIVWRLNPNGTFDSAFDGDGRRPIPSADFEHAYAIARQPNGRIVIGGGTAADLRMVAYRLRAGGALDTSFNGTGRVTFDNTVIERLRGLALQADGKIVVAGQTMTGANAIVYRLNENGSFDMSFNGTGKRPIDSGGTEEAEAVVVQPDGRIVVAGHTTVGFNAAVYRLNPSGSFDTTFDGDGAVGIDGGEVEGALALALQPNGRIVVGGWTTVNDNAAVFRLKGI